MKRRPRRIEQEAAACLSTISAAYGFREVYRIPVLGRTGPDIEINELGLVVDVKSRQAVPKSVFPPLGKILLLGELMAVRLDQFPLLLTPKPPFDKGTPTRTVLDWWLHMDAWRLANFPEGTTALILHRPGMRVRGSALVIHTDERMKLCQKILQ